MKHNLVFALIIFSSCCAFAEKQFSIEPYVSIREGTLHEFLYASENEDQEISLLEWEYSPLYCLGLITSLKINQLNLYSKFDFALPANCGSMYDSDYFYLNDKKDKCNYSRSENYAILNFNSEIGISYDFDLYDFLSVSPSLQLQYIYNGFKAKNGTGRYGRAPYSKTGIDVNWESPDSKVVSKLYGCEFSRHTLYTWTGLESELHLNHKMDLGFGFFISPCTYTHSVDHHLNKPGYDTYLKMTNNILFAKWKYKIFYNVILNQRISVTSCLEFIKGKTAKGKSRIADSTEHYYPLDQKSSSNMTQTSFSVGFKIKI